MKKFDGYKESVKKLLLAAETDLEFSKHLCGTIADVITVETKEFGALGLATELVEYNPYYEKAVYNLLGNILICDTIQHATAIVKKHPNRFKIVTLDGDIIAINGLVTGGESQKRFGVYFADLR